MRVMTTFRLLRQTSRPCRFAQVTVDVDPSGGPGLEVAATVAAEFRHEADLGAGGLCAVFRRRRRSP